MASVSPESLALLEDALTLLGERLSPDVRLADVVELESESTVIRARLIGCTDSDRGVVIKRVTDTGFDMPGHEGAPQRLLNEWAGLDFLAEVGGAGVVAPRLIAGDRGKCILITEEFGPVGTVESKLIDEHSEDAWRGLLDFAGVLGSMHGMTWGKESRFAESQRRVGTGSPMSDTTIDQRNRRGLFTACFEAAGIDLSDRLWRSIEGVEQLVHEQSPFRTLTHADAGPHNVLLCEGGARLIDFEFCVFHNGLTDAAGARLGFPQTAQAMRVPETLVTSFESRYREALAEHVMVAEDDRQFRWSLASSCAHWAMNRIASAWLLHVAPRMDSGQEPAPLDLERVALTSLLVEGFVSYARGEGVLEELADAIEAVGRRWRGLWPGVRPIDVYPALRNVG